MPTIPHHLRLSLATFENSVKFAAYFSRGWRISDEIDLTEWRKLSRFLEHRVESDWKTDVGAVMLVSAYVRSAFQFAEEVLRQPDFSDEVILDVIRNFVPTHRRHESFKQRVSPWLDRVPDDVFHTLTREAVEVAIRLRPGSGISPQDAMQDYRAFWFSQVGRSPMSEAVIDLNPLKDFPMPTIPEHESPDPDNIETTPDEISEKPEIVSSQYGRGCIPPLVWVDPCEFFATHDESSQPQGTLTPEHSETLHSALVGSFETFEPPIELTGLCHESLEPSVDATAADNGSGERLPDQTSLTYLPLESRSPEAVKWTDLAKPVGMAPAEYTGATLDGVPIECSGGTGFVMPGHPGYIATVGGSDTAYWTRGSLGGEAIALPAGVTPTEAMFSDLGTAAFDGSMVVASGAHVLSVCAPTAPRTLRIGNSVEINIDTGDVVRLDDTPLSEVAQEFWKCVEQMCPRRT